MTKLVKTADLYECNVPYLKDLFNESVYPWDMLGKIKGLCAKLIEEGIEGFSEIETGILVGRDVKIAPTATIIPPAIIGHGTEIRPGAYLRGNVITGENCVLGNSSEFKNCILLDKVQAPHYNYVGDSVVGNYAHLGAGAIISNLKSTKTQVVIDGTIETGLRKVGAFLGDHVEVGCNSVLNPGTVIGKGSIVYPVSCIRGIIPPNCIVSTKITIIEREKR